MKPAIDATWGWDEEFQLRGFDKSLSPEYWEIISSGSGDIGGFVLKHRWDHLWLEMIIIEPSFQKNGVGRVALTHMQSRATEKRLPLRLSVIKANPVMPFYEKLGFSQYDEDEAFYDLEWRS